MRTGDKGELAILKVLERCIVKQVVASRPTTEERYDLVLDEKGKLDRAQVKYGDGKSSNSQGAVRVGISSYNLTKGQKPYSSSEIDVMMVYLPRTGKVYRLPKEVWEGKKSLQLRIAAPKNGQVRGCIEAAKFEW